MTRSRTTRTRTAKPRQKHIPQRTCVACRASGEKRALVRLVRAPDGRVTVDPTGKQNGRGAYLCPDRECWDLAFKRRSIERALHLRELHGDDRVALQDYVQGLAASAIQVDVNEE